MLKNPLFAKIPSRSSDKSNAQLIYGIFAGRTRNMILCRRFTVVKQKKVYLRRNIIRSVQKSRTCIDFGMACGGFASGLTAESMQFISKQGGLGLYKKLFKWYNCFICPKENDMRICAAYRIPKNELN